MIGIAMTYDRWVEYSSTRRFNKFLRRLRPISPTSPLHMGGFHVWTLVRVTPKEISKGSGMERGTHTLVDASSGACIDRI